MRSYLLFCIILWSVQLSAQLYTVNTDDDADNGVCNAIHCSLREAINAAEADGVASTIVFNIPGVGPHSIVPSGPYPTIINDDLQIIGESQPGGPGSVIINFDYRNFNGIGFWNIIGRRFVLSGIDFTDFLFNNNGDQVLQFGDINNNAADSKITNCSFITDNSLLTIPDSNLLITVYKADNIIISNNSFGTDHSKSFISKLDGHIKIDKAQGISKVVIDSNVFANKIFMIQAFGGDLHISKNIFGALDTSKIINFLNPNNAIDLEPNVIMGFIQDNFFFGFNKPAINFSISNGECTISKNRFYNCTHGDISNCCCLNSKIYVVDNYARHGLYFMDSFIDQDVEFYMERNDIEDYNHVLLISDIVNPNNKLVRYIDNKMTCIQSYDVQINSNGPVTKVSSVNRNQITGTGLPNDSIVVYFNPRLACPNAICQGGIELGRTKADAVGNWTLNALYPNKTSISAYEFNGNPKLIPNYYSVFSDCYKCPGLVKINFSPNVCIGQTINYRGKVYSQANATDSIFVSGDSVSICDSVILVKLNYHLNYKSKVNTPVCYQDTLHFGAVKIYSGHLMDSLMLQSSLGCDSFVVITGKEVGVSMYSNSYCDSLSIKIGSTVFDKNNSSGIARIPGGSVSGCDSVIVVNLTFKFSPETFINKTLCTGQSLKVSGQVFDVTRPKGDVTLSNVTSSGCDSIIHVNLSFPNTIGFFSTTICSGDSILVGNNYFSEMNSSGTVTLQNGSRFGCDSIINVTITVLPKVFTSVNKQICSKDIVQVGNQFFSAQNPNGIVLFPKGSSMGCDSLVNVALSVNPSIQLNYDATELKCNAANTGELVLKDINGGSGNFKVAIDNGVPITYNQGQIIGNLSLGSHTIHIIDQQACDTIYNFTINNSQILSLQLPNDTTIHKGSPVNINAKINFNPIDIVWNPKLYLSCDSCLNPQSIPDSSITYTLTLTDKNGCLITDNISISIIIDQAELFIPNIFSPNGDNINDIFAPVFKFPNSTSIKVFRIFDRWGNLIYERLNGETGESFGWDGTANHEKMNPGVYIYTIQYIGEDKILKWKTGDVLLMR